MQGTGGFLNPQKVINELDIKAASRVAHFGCGHGYFTIPLAALVGKDGQIFAVDILKEALEEVKAKAEKEGLTNIETIWGNLELPAGSKLMEQSCDFVLLANILFQSQKKDEIIKEAARILKPGGKMAIVDWRPDGATITSDSGWRISSRQAQGLAEKQNFALEKAFDAGDYHYGLLLRKF